MAREELTEKVKQRLMNDLTEIETNLMLMEELNDFVINSHETRKQIHNISKIINQLKQDYVYATRSETDN